MARIEFKFPDDEKLEIQASAADHGLTVSVYLRALALQDREWQEREQPKRKAYPDKPVLIGTDDW